MFRRFKEIKIAQELTPLTSITDEFMWYEDILSDISCKRVESTEILDMFTLIEECRISIRDEIES